MEIMQLDPEYKAWVKQLKEKVYSARMRAVLAVNREQIKLYWEIGKAIIDQQRKAAWGSKLLEQISRDLRAAFPDMKGFSRSNLKRMRRFAQVYPEFEMGPQPVDQLPWGHLAVLIEKIEDPVVRAWYVEQAIENGWARTALERHIKSELYERQGKGAQKLSNFKARLPAPQSDLAHDMIKAPYDLSFMPLSHKVGERELEESLVGHVRKLLMELGRGFAFVGNQYHLEVGGDDFYIDLLFFNVELNAYVVVELKRGKFKPEYAGKLNFYIAVVDDLLKKEHHAPTIGLLLCEDKNRMVAEYALSKSDSPMGISEYQLSKKIPKALRGTLPSAELLEDKLSSGEVPVEI